MTDRVEVHPDDRSLLVFDGDVLEVFAGSESSRVHAKGITGIQVMGGWGSAIRVSYRFGPDHLIAFDKERAPAMQQFANQVLAAARKLQGG